MKFEPRSQLLTFEEIERFPSAWPSRSVCASCVFTGGEPLLRRDLPVLVEKLAAIEGIRDIALTTNRCQARGTRQGSLCNAGLRRINVHLDTLDRARFQKITRRDELDRVLEGIEVCRRLGYGPLKINAVAVKNLVEPDIVPLARFGREHGIEIRYIEFMPLDAQGLWLRDKVLLADDMLALLARDIGPLRVIPDQDPRAPATEYEFEDGVGRVGFIASSEPAVLLEL